MSWAVRGGRVSSCQKGFWEFEGCHEHNFLLQAAIDEEERGRKTICMARLDQTNSFGSIPHQHLINTMERMHNSSEWWRNNNDAPPPSGETDPINIRFGVKQGCPLSPTVFNLGIEPVVWAAESLEDSCSVDVFGHRLSILAYADDLVLMGKDLKALQERMTRIGEFPGFCIGHELQPPEMTASPVRDTAFNIQGGTPACLREGEPYAYLRVTVGFNVSQSPEEDLRHLTEDVKKINESLFAPWQKFRALNTFLLSRLSFILWAGHLQKKLMQELDKLIRACGKKWLSLPRRASPEVLYLHHRHGGAGLLPVADLLDILRVVHRYRLLHCRDPVVRRVAWGRLRVVVQRNIRRNPTTADCAEFLSGSLREKFGNPAMGLQI
ncbi:hypothetical protein J437_LFUL004171 [Ladona fulva]|uniref:Reverse transcriptase domain-containing protein n=1 Tax=Ladona fulva TaxID=123851 RepID=A0A8K0NXW3_LADFU|nr:hypothetical protein J437_LFUL004171 [Ladona fulva]